MLIPTHLELLARQTREWVPPAFNQLTPRLHGGALVWNLSTGPLNENCLLVRDAASDAAFLIDPGADAAQISRLVLDAGAEVAAILLTHAHPDHIGAVQPLREEWEVPVYLHPQETAHVLEAPALAAALGMADFVPLALPVQALEDGQTFRAGGLQLTAHHLPGHSPGHVIFAAQGFVLAGDTLFQGAIAPTNRPDADRETLLQGIVRKLLTQPPDTVIYPGHGAPTTAAAERGRPLFRRRLAAASLG